MDATSADLLVTGPDVLIVTTGVKSCQTYTSEGSFATSAYQVRPIDTTGAGDVFSAGFIAAFLEAKKLQDCVQYALAMSALTTTKKGTRTGLPTRSQVEEFLRNTPPSGA